MPTGADDRLIELLGQAMEATEPIPSALIEDARGVFTWWTIDAELLALGSDSAVDELVGVRSASNTARLLRFGTGEVGIEVDVVEGDLEGVVLGADVSQVRLERPDGLVARADVDELGRFHFPGVVAGPIRLSLGDDDRRHVTEWFLV